MPIQQIELEEVSMGISDEAFDGLMSDTALVRMTWAGQFPGNPSPCPASILMTHYQAAFNFMEK